jgi:hypothetical protein
MARTIDLRGLLVRIRGLSRLHADANCLPRCDCPECMRRRAIHKWAGVALKSRARATIPKMPPGRWTPELVAAFNAAPAKSPKKRKVR